MGVFGCAGKRVNEKTSPQELGSSVGYVAFRYERENDESAELNIRHSATSEDYRFRLDKGTNSVYVTLLAWKVYEKKFGDTVQPPLVVVPLPAGEYECRRLDLSAKFPTWLAFLLQTGGRSDARFLKGKTLSVAADTVTYIGTYHTQAKAKFLGGVDYRVKTVDDGDARAVKSSLKLPFRKRLLALE
jgi:hypothetical protein